MKLNLQQKCVLVINLSELIKSVYPPHYLPQPLQPRAVKIMEWLTANIDKVNSPEHIEDADLPPLEDGTVYGAIELSEIEVGDAITQVMEAVIAAELTTERQRDPPPPPTKLIAGRMRNIRRHGRRSS